VLDAVKLVKSKCLKMELLAATLHFPDGACELARAGADGIKSAWSGSLHYAG